MKMRARARTRRPFIDERQLCLDFRAQLSFRQTVLDMLEESGQFATGAQVAKITGLRYKQAIDVLYALHRDGLIVRDGRKFTCRWGCKRLAKPSPYAGIGGLETLFRGIFRKPEVE